MMVNIKMDLWMELELPEWAKEFKEASPEKRAVMLAFAIDAFNDGQPGVKLSFSEPEINER